MRIIKISFISLTILSLSACTTVRDRYGFLKDEKQVYQKAPQVERAIIIPQNLNSKAVQDYYEVPQNVTDDGFGRPSLTPPGSHVAPGKSVMDRIRSAESAKIQGHTSKVSSAPTPVGVNYSQAWVKVGHVLRAGKYKIVEKDNSLGTYYVIDTASTDGKVKKDMPIYQVNLKPSGNGTIVTVTPSNPRLQTQLERNLND